MKHDKQRIPWFLFGVLATLLVLNLTVPAFAAVATKLIEVSSDVEIYVDGAKMEPTDAGGNPVETFIYNGTTYVPLRAVSQSLGKAVSWDGANRRVYIGEVPGEHGSSSGGLPSGTGSGADHQDEDGARQEGGFPDSEELAVSAGKRLTLVMQEPTDNQDGSSLRTYGGFQVFDGETLIQTIMQDDVIQDDNYLFEGFLADYGGLTVQDVNFDGAEDFGVVCGSAYNGPQCWFVWDQAAGRFRFSFFSSSDLRVDRDKKQLADVWRDGNAGIDYYIYTFDDQGNRVQIDHYYEVVR